MDIFAQLAQRIISEQETIIGPIALEQAKKVQGLSIDWAKKEIKIDGNESQVIEKLVEQYKDFFGNASVDVCKEAVKNLIKSVPQNDIPPLLSK